MFSGMTSAERLGEICVIVFIAAAVLATLAIIGATRHALVAAPSERSFREWLDSYADRPAPAPQYREPADEALVDALADRVRGVARVFHNPSPQRVDNAETAVEPLLDIPHPELPATPRYRVTLAELVEGARYVVPIPTRHVSTAPVSAPAHYSGTIDTSARHSDRVGRHRAAPAIVTPRRELVAA